VRVAHADGSELQVLALRSRGHRIGGEVVSIFVAESTSDRGSCTGLTLEEADALWRELERRVTDEKVRRAEAARTETP
jgi:hypothetical protein